MIEGDYDHYVQKHKKIMQRVQDVFEGRQDEILQDITTQIQTAIEDENFERAARLRDIYRGLEDLIQRQHVVMDIRRSGHVRQIQHVGTWRVYVIATFQQGRLVDIIRQRASDTDMSLNELLTLLQVEYGQPTLVTTDNHRQLSKTDTGREVDRDDRGSLVEFLDQYVAHGIIGITGDSYLHKQYYADIGPVLANALESYIVSTSRESESVMNDILTTFQQRYMLKSFPYHIECVDISHMGGKHTS